MKQKPLATFNQGDIVELIIEGISNEGSGIARIGEENFVIFVEDALPSEKISCRIVQKKRTWASGKVLERKNTAEIRRAPLCSSALTCGGCTHQHICYSHQLETKKQTVKDALERIGHFEDFTLFDCKSSPSEFGYRNKASIPVAWKNGKFLAGFYKKLSHYIVPFASCPVLALRVEEICKILLAEIEKNKLSNVREIVVRSATNGTDSLACVIMTRQPSKQEIETLKRIAKGIKQLTGLSVNINESDSNFIWGDKFINIYGKDTMTETLDGLTFTMEVSSFFQINSLQAEQLYKYVIELLKAGEEIKSNILELYSGVGSLTCFLARAVKNTQSVLAVESWKPASKYITHNAEQNNLSNVGVMEMEAEDAVELLEQKGEMNFDAVVLDPPRSGCDKRVLEALIKISAPKIIYVSCNPATLARDAEILCQGGYKLISAKPFDMFPETGHVETVALMSRVDK